MKSAWEDKLKEVLEKHNGNFGHNTRIDIKRYLCKIEKLVPTAHDNDFAIEIVDYYTIKITLPQFCASCTNMGGRDNILLHILTTSPMPTECRFNKKKDQLAIEWHY